MRGHPVNLRILDRLVAKRHELAALLGGLVLIVMLIGFTVTQFAFRSAEPAYGALPLRVRLRAVAVASSFCWSNASRTSAWIPVRKMRPSSSS